MTPLDGSGRVNESELRRYVDWLIVHGVHGIYSNGSTGEFTRFTADERRQITRIICDEARGRVPVLAGAAEANVRETLRACEVYGEFGVRAVAIVAPFYYRLGPEAVYAYFKEIALHSPVDVTLYNIPMLASPIDVRTVQRLAEFPRIIGIKDSTGDIGAMLRMMAAVEPARPDFAFLTGWDPTLVPMLAMGCHGATLATSGVVPEMTRRLFELASAGQLDRARPLQMRLTELFDRIIYGTDFPEGVRAAVEARGFVMGASRQPVDEGRALDRQQLGELIDRTLAGVDRDEPRNGCDVLHAAAAVG